MAGYEAGLGAHSNAKRETYLSLVLGHVEEVVGWWITLGLAGG